MFLALSERFEVIPIQVSNLDRIVYDQNVNKFARYCLFLFDEAMIFFRTLRMSREKDIELIFSENSYLTLATGLAGKIRGVPVVWDNHGNVKLYAESLGKSSFFKSANILLERVLEKLVARVLVVSPRDKDAYGDMGFDISKFEVVPICADVAAVDRNRLSMAEARRALAIPDGEAVVLFFGTLKYRPNLEAMEYIVRRLAPRLKEKAPALRFYIAGGGSYPGELPDSVRHLGFVPFDPDLCRWLYASDICIAPLWKGVGVLTKVVDMLSAAKPTVLTEVAVAGIRELEDGVNCLVGKDEASFEAAVERLLADENLRRRLGTNGRRLIEEKYSWEVVGPRVCGMVDRLTS